MENQNGSLEVVPEQNSSSDLDQKKSRKNPGVKAFLYGVVAILALGAIVGGYFYARYISDAGHASLKERIVKKLNLSVASVNGMEVKYSDYADDLAGIKKFYTKAPADTPKLTDDQLSDQVLSRLIANKLVGAMAKDYKIIVEKNDMDEAEGKLLASFPDKATAEKEIGERYGWSLQKYLERVVRPFILEKKLSEVFASSTDPSLAQYEEEQLRARHILVSSTDVKTDVAAKKKAEILLRRVTVGKEDFAKVAAEASDDPGSKVQGGDVGWFGMGVMVPEFEKAALALKPSQITPNLVKTQFGYHIIKLEERKKVKNFFKYIRDTLMNAEITVASFIHNPFIDLKKQVDAANVETK